MNERLKQLAEQASEYAWDNNPDEDSYGRPANPGKFQQDRDTKFSELIVRECIASIPSDGHRGDFGRAVEFCQQQIKQHFGVEEPEQSASDRILSTIRKRG